MLEAWKLPLRDNKVKAEKSDKSIPVLGSIKEAKTQANYCPKIGKAGAHRESQNPMSRNHHGDQCQGKETRTLVLDQNSNC